METSLNTEKYYLLRCSTLYTGRHPLLYWKNILLLQLCSHLLLVWLTLWRGSTFLWNISSLDYISEDSTLHSHCCENLSVTEYCLEIFQNGICFAVKITADKLSCLETWQIHYKNRKFYSLCKILMSGSHQNTIYVSFSPKEMVLCLILSSALSWPQPSSSVQILIDPVDP
jgi:hypothetical protein